MPADPDPNLIERLERHRQGHLLKWWSTLTHEGRNRLRREIVWIDFEQLDRLIGELVHSQAAPATPPELVRPIEVIRLPQTDGQRVARRRALEEGARALAAGEVGVIVVAG